MKNITFSESGKKLISEALKALGKKNLTLIVHGGSFPAAKGEDVGFGTPNSEAAHKFMEYISGIFTSIQLGPAGKTKKSIPSPYTGTVFSSNPLFADLKLLTTDEWDNLLKTEELEPIYAENPNADSRFCSYEYIYSAHAEMMLRAYRRFSKLTSSKLRAPFEKFCEANRSWLEKDALYEALCIENGNECWNNWENEQDKDLMLGEPDEKQLARISEIKAKYEEQYNLYLFIQFIVDRQNELTKKFASKLGLNLIADRQVAFSDRDIWANRSLFLKGRFLGCPPDYFSKEGQAWGFPIMDPEKLFLPDGSLGEAGILMKSLYRKLFEENRGGVRIDHTIGLIDPWVYKDGFKPLYEEGGGRLYSSPELEDLKQYAIPKMEDIDETVLPDEEMRVKTLSEEQLARYALFLEKIVIAAACESGLDKDSIICEDLGSTTHPVVEVMKRTGLQGMRVTPFADPNDPKHPYRCKNIPHESWAMVGTHDNQPLLNWTESIVYTHTSYLHALNLMEDLWPDISEHEKEEMVVRMTKDAKFLAFIKYVELFASKADNIQIFFSDLFGFKEVYNIPGTSEENNNWALRIPVDYEEIYEENCANGRAMELVSILKAAIEARGEKFAAEHSDLLDRMEHLLTVNS